MSELLTEIQRLLQQSGDDGMTITELLEAGGIQNTNHRRARVRASLTTMMKTGRVTLGRGVRMNMTGTNQVMPVFKFIE